MRVLFPVTCCKLGIGNIKSSGINHLENFSGVKTVFVSCPSSENASLSGFKVIGLFLFGILWKVLGLDLEYCRTMVFGVLVVNTAFVIFGYKNLKKNIFQYNPFSNKVLNLAALIILIFFALSIYLTPFQKLLHTVALGWESWLILISISLVSLVLIELTKWYFISRRLIQE